MSTPDPKVPANGGKPTTRRSNEVEEVEARLRRAEARVAATPGLPRRRVMKPVAVIVIVILFLVALVAVVLEQAFQPPPPPPLTFADLPIRIEAPDQPNVPLPLTVRPRFHPGDRIVTLPYRCATDDGGTGLGELHYTFTRALFYADEQPPRRALDMPDGESDAPLGCSVVPSTSHYVPDKAQPGFYYLGGTATPTGPKRSATVAWRTADFEVVP